MNAKYGKIEDGRFSYAPDALAVEGGVKMNPSEASYLAAGYKKVVDAPPEAGDGKMAVVSSYAEDADAITVVYKIVDAPETGKKEETDDSSGGGTADESGESATPPADAGTTEEPETPKVKVYSKLAILEALKAADCWVIVKTWMEEKAYYDHYLAAQNFAADNPLFLEGVAAFKKYTGKTDEEVQAVLDKCICTE